MAKNAFKAKEKKKVETLTHEKASRRNIPTAEFQSVMRAEEQSPIRVAYERRNRDLDPQLVWRGKDETGLVRSGRSCAASLHPGESSSQSADRRLAPTNRSAYEECGNISSISLPISTAYRAKLLRPSSISTMPTGAIG